MYELILVSQSPRRKELLKNANYKFRTHTVKVSEIIDENLNLDRAIEEVAKTKAMAFVEQNKSLKSQRILILSADTVVVLDSKVLGKPQNKNEAVEFLTQLSGRTHSVKTAVCVYDFYDCQIHSEICTTQVTFRKLSKMEIEEYVQTGEPMDKAGAYGIQGLASKFVSKIEGDFSNVVGLPIFKLEEMEIKYGWKIYRTEMGSHSK
jgi:septum formation protein